MRTRQEIRKRTLAKRYSKTHKISVAKAYQHLDVIEEICAALGPLSPNGREKTLRCIQILIEPDRPPRKHEVSR